VIDIVRFLVRLGSDRHRRVSIRARDFGLRLQTYRQQQED
jgi:hypothetical protein